MTKKIADLDLIDGEMSFPRIFAIREKRLAKIKEAMATLEEAHGEAANQTEGEVLSQPQKRRGRKLKNPPGVPKDKDQHNFTDPESRIMKNSDKAFTQTYNAQAVVDSQSQIVVAANRTNQASDSLI
ncbi:MAG TPA: hypothetical protein GX530_07650 [Corynebacteriales bacterium]|nr:hypothetical protein [Mycobacteriales bacterium]